MNRAAADNPAQARRPSSVVVCSSGHGGDGSSRAEEVARALGLPLVDRGDRQWAASDLAVYVTEHGLSLGETGSRARPISVDFLRGRFAVRSKRGPSRRALIARAVGVSKGFRSVVDATAGLGRDAMTLARLGCCVTAVERCAVLVALLNDGLSRAARDGPHEVREAVGRIRVIAADARDVLAALGDDHAHDVIYLDPMYPDTGKSALAKKEMRICRRLVGDDADAAELLDRARAVARRRVVVKRHLRAPSLGGEPDIQYAGKLVRFDVYETRARAAPRRLASS